jgi:hypothetical protein
LYEKIPDVYRPLCCALVEHNVLAQDALPVVERIVNDDRYLQRLIYYQARLRRVNIQTGQVEPEYQAVGPLRLAWAAAARDGIRLWLAGIDGLALPSPFSAAGFGRLQRDFAAAVELLRAPKPDPHEVADLFAELEITYFYWRPEIHQIPCGPVETRDDVLVAGLTKRLAAASANS